MVIKDLGERREGWISWVQRIITVVKLFLYCSLVVKYIIPHSLKPTDYTIPGVNIIVNIYGLWVIMVHQCSFIDYNTRTATHQASLSFTILQFAQIHVHWINDSIHHLILCCPLILLSTIWSSIRVFSGESTLCIRWPKYYRSFSISPSKEYSGLISLFFFKVFQQRCI